MTLKNKWARSADLGRNYLTQSVGQPLPDPPTQEVNKPRTLRHRPTPGTGGDVSCRSHYGSRKAFTHGERESKPLKQDMTFSRWHEPTNLNTSLHTISAHFTIPFDSVQYILTHELWNGDLTSKLMGH